MARRKSPYYKNSVKTGKYKSKLEDAVAAYLTKKKLDYSYESVKMPYTVERVYKVDFVLPTPKRRAHWEKVCYFEVKGFFSAQDRSKMLSVRKCNPKADIRLIFQRDNPLYKGSKSRYSDWAESHGFKWYEINDKAKLIPDEWLEECNNETK